MAISIAVIQGVQATTNAALPGQLSWLITAAPNGDPYLPGLVNDPQRLPRLFDVFLRASLPKPTLQACDNSGLVVSGNATTQAPCLNAPPIAAPAADDPQFLITPQGSTQARPLRHHLVDGRRDRAPGAGLAVGPQFTASPGHHRLSGDWFVTHVTDAYGNPPPPKRPAPTGSRCPSTTSTGPTQSGGRG